MALPIAHATAGFLIHRLDGRRTRLQGWLRALVYMAIANSPDADFLIGFALGAPGLYHRGVSHTLVAAIVFGAVAALISRAALRDRWWPAAVAFGSVYASHLVVDALTIDARPPVGAAFFWPFSDAYYGAPVTLFHEILIDGQSRLGFVDSILQWRTAAVLGRELAIAAVITMGVLAVQSVWRAVGARRATLPLVGTAREEDLA